MRTFGYILAILLIIQCSVALNEPININHNSFQLSAMGSPIPTIGTQLPLLTIFVDFPDAPATVTLSQMKGALFSASIGLHQYYAQVSYGLLTYLPYMLGNGTGTTAKALRMPHPRTYYANGHYGFSCTPYPKCHAGLVMDALTTMGNMFGGNFSMYANPVTKKIDNLIVVYAGNCWTASAPYNNASKYLLATSNAIGFQTLQIYNSSLGYTANEFTLCPELDEWSHTGASYNGRCIHEHGHGLGYADLYDFDTTRAGGLGQWDLMAYGLWGYSHGQKPFHPSAYTRQSWGFLTPTVIDAYDIPRIVKLLPIASSPAAIRINPFNNRNATEYFMLENRQGVYPFESGMLCGNNWGLLVIHLDEFNVKPSPAGWSPFSWNRVNTIAPSLCEAPYACNTHPGAVVIEADNNDELIKTPFSAGRCLDLYSTASGNSIWNDSRSALWNTTNTGISVAVTQQCDDGGILLKISGVGLSYPIEYYNDSCNGPIINGGWGNWSTACINGTIVAPLNVSTCINIMSGWQERNCDSPTPQNRGLTCVGESIQACTYQNTTEIQGGWSEFSNCTVVNCGDEMGYQNRTCNQPEPSCGGLFCFGEDFLECNNTQPCMQRRLLDFANGNDGYLSFNLMNLFTFFLLAISMQVIFI